MNEKEKQTITKLVRVVEFYLDPDEPKSEWEDGVWKALAEVKKLLGE